MELPFWCPLGYATVQFIPAFILQWRDQGHTFRNWPEHLSAQGMLNHIGRALACGELQAFGVPTSGEGVLKVSSGVWGFQVPDPYGGWRKSDQFTLVLQDQEHAILSEPYIGPLCRPVVRLDDLAAWLGATIEPDPPAIAPARRLVPVKPANEDGMHAWMLGYAQARKDAGNVIKRDEALSILQQHFPPPNTTREHEAAYEALPFPDLRNSPRTQKDS